MTSSALPKRILIVDDHPPLLKNLKYELENTNEDYEVETASSEQQAFALLDCQVFHVAVVDVRLRDNRDPQDYSGFAVARRAVDQRIPTIVHTAFQDPKGEMIQKALAADGVQANFFVDKSDHDPERLQQRIRQCVELCKVNFNLTIHVAGSTTLDDLAAMLSRHRPDCAPADAAALRYVLAALFHDASSVLISPLVNGHFSPMPSGALTVIVKPTYAQAAAAATFVKISRASEIRTEGENHREFSRYLQGAPRTSLDGSAYAGQFGALQYALLGMAGGIYQTFSQYYDATADPQRLSSVVLAFFDRAYTEIYASIQSVQGDLTALYTEALNLSLSEVTTSIRQLVPHDLSQQRLTIDGITLNNPLLFIRSEDAHGQPIFRPMVQSYRQCLCHGDLHTRNILVGNNGEFWLIDFARVGVSHALRDIAELEADIKFSVLKNVTVQEYTLLERALCSDTGGANGLHKPELLKAYHLVKAMRGYMRTRINPVNAREYQTALLYNALKVITLKRDQDREKKKRALITASVLVDVMQGNPLPPNSANGAAPDSPAQARLLVILLIVVLVGMIALYLASRDPWLTLAGLLAAVVVTLVLVGRLTPEVLTKLLEIVLGRRG